MAVTKAKLRALKKVWAEAKESGGFTDFEDGFYEAELKEAELQESKSSGRLQVLMVWEVVEGDEKGKSYRDYQGIDNEVGAAILMGNLVTLGAEEVDSPEDLGETLTDLQERGIVARVELKTKGDFQNLRIRKVLENGEDLEDEDEDEGGEDGGAPLVGDVVVVKVGKEEKELEVLSVDEEEETFTAKVGRKKKTFDFDDILRWVEEDDDEGDSEDVIPKVGDSITVEDDDGSPLVVSVLSVDEEEETFTAKVGRKKKTFDFDDIMGDLEEEEEDEVGVGSTVAFQRAGKENVGTVISISGTGRASVKLSTGKVRTVAADKLELVEE